MPVHPAPEPSPLPAGTLGLVVLAAGRGERFGRDKVWLPMRGQPLLVHCLRALAAPPVARVALVVSAEHLPDAQALSSSLPLPAVAVVGGARRQDSVANGLQALGACDWVAVHDAARPLATRDLLLRTWRAAQTTGAAIAAVPQTETVKRVRDGQVVETLPRAELWAVQTPQVFRTDLLRRAHATIADDVTDDAALVERLGVTVRIAEGSYANIKVTTPDDLALAAFLWQQQESGSLD